jgi:hypothetical protein
VSQKFRNGFFAGIGRSKPFDDAQDRSGQATPSARCASIPSLQFPPKGRFTIFAGSRHRRDAEKIVKHFLHLCELRVPALSLSKGLLFKFFSSLARISED